MNIIKQGINRQIPPLRILHRGPNPHHMRYPRITLGMLAILLRPQIHKIDPIIVQSHGGRFEMLGLFGIGNDAVHRVGVGGGGVVGGEVGFEFGGEFGSVAIVEGDVDVDVFGDG